MRKILFILVASVAFFLPVSAHAFCYGVPESTIDYGHVCGTLARLGSSDGINIVSRPAGQSYVKICPSGQSSSSIHCSTTSTSTFDDGPGTAQKQAWVFLNYRQSATTYEYFDLYAWGAASSDYWGSSTKPIKRLYLGLSGQSGIGVSMPPRPLDPTPVYPSGNAVGSSYTVTWKSGIDVDRKPYPVNYQIWFKYWPFGGTEPASWTLSRSNMPCQDNGGGPNVRGECSTYVAGPQASGNWKWYAVANLNVSSQVPSYTNTVFTTTSGSLYFSAP
ncbi:MAG TPA: hypothetical protein VLB76_20940 [Thermoanaerobaculia bacterium]|nr:hypothetical protein [Thermoanaerobaculia bacterium]